jgi:hypothetical protein
MEIGTFAQTELGIIKPVLRALNPKAMSGNAHWSQSWVQPSGGRTNNGILQLFQEPLIALYLRNLSFPV